MALYKEKLTWVKQSISGCRSPDQIDLAAAKAKHLLIALRGHPDPDGIASALAQSHIAQRLGVSKTTIGYCHDLSHRENRALVKLLNVEMKKLKNVNAVKNPSLRSKNHIILIALDEIVPKHWRKKVCLRKKKKWLKVESHYVLMLMVI